MTFYRFLVVLLILDAVVLVAAILAQSGKGGGMAASFGGASSSDALFGARQAGNLLTKASWWCGGLFIGIAFILELSAGRSRTPTSVLDKTFTPTKTAPASKAPATTTPPNVPLQSLPEAGKADPKAPPPTPAKKP